MNKEYTVPRVFEILEGANQGFFGAFVKVKDGKVSVFYEKPDEPAERFLDIDVQRREIIFYSLPKSYLAEQACIGLASDLKKEGFKVGGLADFIEKPIFKEKDRISLY